MRNGEFFFFLSLLLIPFFTISQNAPVTQIPDTTGCPGSPITIPIRVTNFNHVGSVSLKLLYNTSSLTYLSWSNSSGYPGLTLNSSVPGTLVIGGFAFNSGGVTYPNNTIFFKVTFTYSSGNGVLTWLDNGSSCEYAGPYPNFTPLIDIPTSQYYINGAISPSVVANFSASTQFPVVLDTVTFNDISTGSPSSWNWTFSPGSYNFVNGTTQLSQDPQVAFSAHGAYSASLTVSKAGCSSVITRSNWIHAGIAGLWTGEVSGNWYTDSNWDNGVVPDANTDVVIPSSAANWPEFTGDFTIGVQCFNLSIQGLTGQMTVTGDFIIP